jgi:hypothetical protein
MNAHPTSPASVALPGADARGESPGWLSSQVNHSEEQSISFSRGLPAGTNASAAPDRPVAPGEDAATALRSRLLQMIVTNEQLRKSQTDASGSCE